jgi:hypothetical protein
MLFLGAAPLIKKINAVDTSAVLVVPRGSGW